MTTRTLTVGMGNVLLLKSSALQLTLKTLLISQDILLLSNGAIIR